MTGIHDERLAESISYIRERISHSPLTGVVLGSGLSGFEKKLARRVVLKNRDIPHYPVPHIEGHPGRLVFGRISSPKGRLGSPVVLFVGRTHYYESGDIDRVIYPIRVAQKLGVKNLVLTNAAGAVNPAFSPGDLMLITGQINLTFQNAAVEWKTAPPEANVRFLVDGVGSPGCCKESHSTKRGSVLRGDWSLLRDSGGNRDDQKNRR